MKLLGVELIEGAKHSCENCGHMISWIYTIEIEGVTRRVGSECAVLLLGPSAVDRMGKRAKRAATQWRKQLPPAQSNETREQYISRRVTEMGNAIAAHRAWTVIDLSRGVRKVNKWLHSRRSKVCGCNSWAYDPWCKCGIDWSAYVNHVSRKIAKKYNANPFDFNRSTWDVAKI